MTDLDTALRSMLTERAGDIQSLPADFAHLASLDVLDHDPIRDRRRGHRTGWLVAAAVVAVLAVVGATIGIRYGGGQKSNPASPAPTGPSSSASPAPILSLVRRTSCPASLPAAWRSAVTGGSDRYGAPSAFPLAVSADGSTLLVARDHGSARDVVVVDRSGHSRIVYRVPQPDLNRVEHASIDGHRAAIDLERLPRNANGVIGTVLTVVLVDLDAGRATQLDRVTDKDIEAGGRTIDGSLISAGHVYWDVRAKYTAQTATIEDYDIATGRTTVADPGGAGVPQLNRSGFPVSGGGAVLSIPPSLPAPVAAVLRTAGERQSLVTDGAALAWRSATGQLAWWAPGQRRVTEISLAKGARPGPIGVAGPFVFYQDDNSTATSFDGLLVDARTAATAHLPTLQPYALGANGVLIGYGRVAESKESPTEVVRIDTTKLPSIKC